MMLVLLLPTHCQSKLPVIHHLRNGNSGESKKEKVSQSPGQEREINREGTLELMWNSSKEFMSILIILVSCVNQKKNYKGIQHSSQRSPLARRCPYK